MLPCVHLMPAKALDGHQHNISRGSPDIWSSILLQSQDPEFQLVKEAPATDVFIGHIESVERNILRSCGGTMTVNVSAMTGATGLLMTNESNRAAQKLLEEEARQTWMFIGQTRIACFKNLKQGARGDPLVKSLERSLRIILKQAAATLEDHSRYFWLYHWRRFREVLENQRLQDDIRRPVGDVKRGILSDLWLNHRITLAILKYGKPLDQIEDMPPEINLHAMAALQRVVTMMRCFEDARYALKRAIKGGRFYWSRSKETFDVILDPNTTELIERFDARIGGSNFLRAYGSWARTDIGFDFPLPTPFPSYTPLPPVRGVAALSILFSRDSPITLTLTPNVEGRQCKWIDRQSNQEFTGVPPWLFVWVNLKDILPRLELLRGLFKRSIELSGKEGYDPEDFVLTLAALTGYQKEYNEQHNTLLWQQIFSVGYTIWEEANELVEDMLLPRFSRLRQKWLPYRSDVSEDRRRLQAVLHSISWDKESYSRIDVLRFRPVRIIFPIGESVWLIDWSLVQQCLFSVLGGYGRNDGTVARIKGHDLEQAFGEYLRHHVESPEDIWWLGSEKRNVRFSEGASRNPDIAFIVNDCLLLIEVKAYGASTDLYFLGDAKEFDNRWRNKVLPALDQADSLAKRLGREPTGRNYKLPGKVKFIVPVVCCPFGEWIPSLASRYWLYEDMPRICMPEEILELVTRIREGQPPISNRVRIKRI
jgi:hypothetical protein